MTDDRLKQYNDICSPDSRQKALAIYDDQLREYRPKELLDQYTSVSTIRIKDAVPEEIRIHFTTARNLLVYSWFVYRFIPVAEQHAYATVEMALQNRLDKPGMGLRGLLKEAIAQGLIADEGFTIVRERKEVQTPLVDEYEPLEDGRQVESYVNVLLKALPYLRNNLAHGSNSIHPNGYATLQVCAELINQLY